MLVHLHITSRDKAEKRTGGTVLNTSMITEMIVSGTGARFYYCAQPENRRGSREELTVSESVAAIRTLMNTALNAAAITLLVHPDQDPTQAAVWTTFNADEIVRAWPRSRADRTRSWMEVNEKGGIRRYLIDHYYLELVQIVETGTTSTTTTSTVP